MSVMMGPCLRVHRTRVFMCGGAGGYKWPNFSKEPDCHLKGCLQHC